MSRKKDNLEPAVRIGRICFSCGEQFILSHPSSPKLLCEKCELVLGQMIRERRANDEQQEAGN